MPPSSPPASKQTEPTEHRSSTPHPVFILGIMPRSGTNFLHRLLSLHPACSPLEHEAVKEDYLLHHADALFDYADRVAWQWDHWGDSDPPRTALLKHLGNGLTRFLQADKEDSTVITKTPSVRHAQRVFELFPHAKVILLIRDGRSVVASAMAGFDWPFEPTVRKWAQAARTIQSFRETYGDSSDRHMLLRYEDLNDDPASTLKRVFSRFDFDIGAYDFDDAINLPVYGSSFDQESGEDVTWTPSEKPENFNSNKRWSDWTAEKHERFNWLAGEELHALGYRPQSSTSSFPRRHLRQASFDLRYAARSLPEHLDHSLRAGAKAFLSTFRRNSQ